MSTLLNGTYLMDLLSSFALISRIGSVEEEELAHETALDKSGWFSLEANDYLGTVEFWMANDKFLRPTTAIDYLGVYNNIFPSEDAEGNGFILKPNDRVQNGFLVSIYKDKAIFQVTEYGWTRTVALNLQMPELK